MKGAHSPAMEEIDSLRSGGGGRLRDAGAQIEVSSGKGSREMADPPTESDPFGSSGKATIGALSIPVAGPR